MECTLRKSADVTKVWGAADSQREERTCRGSRQIEALNNDRWHEFSKDKCQVLHLVQGNDRHKYRLGDKWLESSLAENDLMVLVSSRLSMSQQSILAARNASHIFLQCIKHSIAKPVKRNDSLTFNVVSASP